MRHSLSLTLAALAVLSVAGCATAPPSSRYTIAEASGGPNCQRLAQPGDTKIQIYCSKAQPERVWPLTAGTPSEPKSGDTTCRSLAQPADKAERPALTAGEARPTIQTFCGNAADWDKFDTRAASEGVTCRWLGGPVKHGPPRQELCLSAALWQRVETNRSRALANDGSNWGGNSGVPVSGPGVDATSSYGYFPSGGAIGSLP
jgi:hypothetical protein